MKRIESLILTILLALTSVHVTAKSQDKDLLKADYLYRHYAFHDAIQYYETVAEQNGSLDVFSKLGDCYMLVKKPAEAAAWYSKAVVEKDCPDEIKLRYAKVLMTLQKYDDAKYYLEQYQAKNTGNRSVMNMIKSCEVAKDMVKSMPGGTVELMAFNTDGSEFGPSINGNNLVFTSDSIIGAGKKIDSWTGSPFYNIYTLSCNNKGKCTNEINRIGGKVNTKYHDGPAVFTRSGEEIMCFTRTNYTQEFLSNGTMPDNEGVVRLQIMIASDYDVIKKEFKKVSAFPYNSKDYSTAHPAISPDGNMMVFTSDMPGGSGGSDLYMCTKAADGKWAEPINLGPSINTEGEEMFPFISNDYTLYFASNGHVGLGGLDIYQAPWRGNAFADVENLGLPFNSSYDDMSLTLYANSDKGFLASNRPAQKKGDNIYYINMQQAFLNVMVKDAVSGEILPASSMKLMSQNDNRSFVGTSAGHIVARVYPQAQYKVEVSKPGYKSEIIDVSTYNLKKDKDTIFKEVMLTSDFAINYNAVVLDETTMKPIDDCMIVFAKLGSSDVDTTYVSTGGKFSSQMDPNEEYHIYAVKNMYYSNERMVSTIGVNPNAGKINLKDTLYMKELKVGEVYKIDNIYYDYDKANIREDAKPSLNGVIELLNQYPDMSIQINSHTDCRGSDSYNLNLSKARANSVMKYLQQRGISNKRLKHKGFGETMPVEKCEPSCDDCTEDQHQRNRRTEFQIITM